MSAVRHWILGYPELQKKAVALLQYALAPGGFLMLGSSENLRSAINQLSRDGQLKDETRRRV